MTRHLRTLAAVVVLSLVVGSVGAEGQADADGKAKAEAAAKEAKEAQQREESIKRAEVRTRLIPLSIDVVVSRYQGEKKVSSLPYSLAVNANDNAPGGVCQLRMGTSVPVQSVGPGPLTYRDIGTNIDCSARAIEDGSFQLRLNVEDSSVYTGGQDASLPKVEQMPVFRTFRSTNTLVLRDGQNRDFTAAADRVSGEVVRIAVTLRVVK